MQNGACVSLPLMSCVAGTAFLPECSVMRLCGCVAVVLLVSVSSWSMGMAQDFVPLFNGKDLSGWHGWTHAAMTDLQDASDEQRQARFDEWTADARKHWSVVDGELINDGHGAYLATDGNYRDYELRLQYRTVPRADSGIYLKGCPQVQIWDYTDPKKFRIGADLGSGGLWNNSPGSRGKDPFVLADRRFGEWNSFRIVQVGSRTSVWLNDQLVVDHSVMENYFDRGAPLPVSGPVVLQTHGGEIRWRNIEIRELTADEANAVLAGHREQAFRSLFDGKTLRGWQGAVDDYEVVDGAIQCRSGRGGVLLTEEEFDHFMVRLEFRLPPGGNNGLAIRAPLEGNPAYEGMCELQVLDSEHEKYARLDPRQYHGSAYGMVPARRGWLRPVGEWNFQEVTVQCSSVRVELNGSVILDADLSEVSEFMNNSAHNGKDRTRGYFGFAGHSDPVAFRNIAVRRLPPPEE